MGTKVPHVPAFRTKLSAIDVDDTPAPDPYAPRCRCAVPQPRRKYFAAWKCICGELVLREPWTPAPEAA